MTDQTTDNSENEPLNGEILRDKPKRSWNPQKTAQNELDFVNYYMADPDQDSTAAYKKVMNNDKLTEASAKVGGSRYLNRPKVIAMIAARTESKHGMIRVEREFMTDAELIADYAFTATCDINDYYTKRGKGIRVKTLDELTPAQRRNIKHIRWGAGKKPAIKGYRLLDREKARDSLAQMMGLKAPDFDFKQLLRVLVHGANAQLPEENTNQVPVRVINHEESADFQRLLEKIGETTEANNDESG